MMEILKIMMVVQHHAKYKQISNVNNNKTQHFKTFQKVHVILLANLKST